MNVQTSPITDTCRFSLSCWPYECQLTKRFTPTTEFKARPDSQVWYIIGRPMSIALWRSFNTSLEEFQLIIVNLGSSVPQVSLFWCIFFRFSSQLYLIKMQEILYVVKRWSPKVSAVIMFDEALFVEGNNSLPSFMRYPNI